MLRWRLWAQQLWRGSEQGWVKEKRGRRVASELRDRTRTQREVGKSEGSAFRLLGPSPHTSLSLAV